MSATSQTVPDVLRAYGEMTRNALEGYLPTGEPRRYLADLIADYPRRGGKMMRPSICMASARAFGASPEAALRCAVSIELLHNALLIWDDIQDESLERRGRPTLHQLHGLPLALNAGNALTVLSLQPLVENAAIFGPKLALRMIEIAETMARESAEGQAIELGWRRDNEMDLAEADYLEMVLKKTCWLATIYPSLLGALVATDSRIEASGFIRFGFFLGAAFQIQDDLLNLVGDHETYGKELNGDIWEGKRTLMLIRLFRESTSEERRRLTVLMRQPREQRCETEVRWVRRLMDSYHCIEHARRMAHGLAGAAAYECTRIYGALPPTRDKQFLEGLTTWVFERQ